MDNNRKIPNKILNKFVQKLLTFHNISIIFTTTNLYAFDKRNKFYINKKTNTLNSIPQYSTMK